MLTAVLVFLGLGLVFGLGLGIAAVRLKVDSDPVVDRIDALLPQTQCGQCSYPGCRPYAEAIARGEADINQCPPGGEETIRDLAALLGRTTGVRPKVRRAFRRLAALTEERP